jgi:hypothetical protein
MSDHLHRYGPLCSRYLLNLPIVIYLRAADPTTGSLVEGTGQFVRLISFFFNVEGCRERRHG